MNGTQAKRTRNFARADADQERVGGEGDFSGGFKGRREVEKKVMVVSGLWTRRSLSSCFFPECMEPGAFADFIEALPIGFVAQAIGYPNDIPLSYAELLELVRSCVPISEPYVIVAESFSTPLAIQFAATNPPKSHRRGFVRGIRYKSSPGLFAIPHAFSGAGSGPSPGEWIGGENCGVRVDCSGVPAGSFARGDGKGDPRVLMDRVRTVVGCNSLEEIREIRVPVLYMQARHDRVVNAVCLEEDGRVKPEIRGGGFEWFPHSPSTNAAADGGNRRELRRQRFMMMADNFAQTVKQQADILRIVGEYVRLKKAGAQTVAGFVRFTLRRRRSFSVHAGRRATIALDADNRAMCFRSFRRLRTSAFRSGEDRCAEVRDCAAEAGVFFPEEAAERAARQAD